MRVRLITDCKGPNPDFNPRLKPDRKTNCHEIDRPKGTEIEHPDAWMLCVGSEPVAEPLDDEAKTLVSEALERRRRGLIARAERAAEALDPATANDASTDAPAEAPAEPAPTLPKARPRKPEPA